MGSDPTLFDIFRFGSNCCQIQEFPDREISQPRQKTKIDNYCNIDASLYVCIRFFLGGMAESLCRSSPWHWLVWNHLVLFNNTKDTQQSFIILRKNILQPLLNKLSMPGSDVNLTIKQHSSIFIECSINHSVHHNIHGDMEADRKAITVAISINKKTSIS